MSSDLDRDLGAWEQGFLALHDVERRHPEDDVWGLIVLHERLSRLTELPAGEPSGTWSRVEPRLRGRPPRRRARVLLAAALLVLLGGATAFAVVFQGGERDGGEGRGVPGRSVRLPRSETAHDQGPALTSSPDPIGAEEQGTARGGIDDVAEGSRHRTQEEQVQDQALTPDDMTDDETPERSSSEDPADDGYPESVLYGPDDDDSSSSAASATEEEDTSLGASGDEVPISAAATGTTPIDEDG